MSHSSLEDNQLLVPRGKLFKIMNIILIKKIIILVIILIISAHPNGGCSSEGGFHKLNYSDRRHFWLNVICPNLAPERQPAIQEFFARKRRFPQFHREKKTRKLFTWNPVDLTAVLNLYQAWASKWSDRYGAGKIRRDGNHRDFSQICDTVQTT